MKKLQYILASLMTFCLLAVPLFALALDQTSEQPMLFWGVSEASWSEDGIGLVNYGEPDGTIVIRNPAPQTLPDLVFNSDCVLDSIIPLSQCFNFNPQSSVVTSTKIYSSNTYADDFLKASTAVMKYPAANVVGNSYLSSGMSNFSYWGRHLRQTGDSTGSNAFWQATNYQFNPSAQAIWSGDNQTMSNTIDRIAASAKDIDSVVTPFYGICGNTSICSEKDQYPEGRAWDFGANRDLTIAGLQYFDRAAIIVEKKKLIITSSISNPSQDSLSNLGFIVRNGDVVISNPDATKSIKINASIFAPNGTITVSGYNITLTGSFVAKNFSVPASSSNINFIEDTRGESAWPPGFRELQLPDVLSK